MASLYKRPGSPFWWVKWCDSTGRVRRESTKFRVGYGPDLVRARQLRDLRAVEESSTPTLRSSEAWSAWVSDYLHFRYANSPLTARRCLDAWDIVFRFIENEKIYSPRQLTREHCQHYIVWRKRLGRGFKPVGHNTAILELKVLRVVMGEAMRRGFCATNPCSKFRDLGIRPDRVKEKPEITDAEIQIIRTAIQRKIDLGLPDPKFGPIHDWAHIFHVSFEIALHQGCRLAETCLDLRRDVDLETRRIRFTAKGNHYFETELNPALLPLFERLRAEGRRTTYEMPANRTLISLAWCKFFKRINLPHLCFHCTRVTFISRMARAGAPEFVTMKAVGHASTTVHRVYLRLQREQIQSFWPKIYSGVDTPAQPGILNAPEANSAPPLDGSASHG